MLPCVGKLFTKVLKERLYRWVERKDILSSLQAGFRKGRSTLDQCFVLRTIIEKTQRRGQRLWGVFVDLKKAFDSVNREALWYKLRCLGVSEKMVRILKSKYADSEFRVRLAGGKLTKPIKSLSGVMQGDQFSSLLFILFLNDLEDQLKPLAEVYSPSMDGGDEISSLWFADDVCLLSTSGVGASRLLECFDKFCKEWNLCISKEKTKVVEFRRKGSRAIGRNLMLEGKTIERVKRFKYLGVVFDEGGSWVPHLDLRRVSADRVGAAIGRLMWKFSDAPVSLGLHIFEVVSKAIMLYGVELAAFSGKWIEMERAARKFYKKLLGLPKGTAGVGVEALLGRCRMRDEAIIKALMFWFRLIRLPEGHLACKAWKMQRDWADRGLKCWGLGVKAELARIGQPGLWERQGDLSMGKGEFKSTVREVIVGQRVAEQIGEGSGMSSCRLYFEEGIEEFGIDRRLTEANGWNGRRRVATGLLGSDGALVTRGEGGKTCVACGERFEGCIFVHKLVECKEARLKALRREKEEFVSKVASLPVGVRGVFLRREMLRGNAGFDFV